MGERYYISLQDRDQYGVVEDPAGEARLLEAGLSVETGSRFLAYDDGIEFEAIILGRWKDGFLRIGAVIKHSKGEYAAADYFDPRFWGMKIDTA